MPPPKPCHHTVQLPTKTNRQLKDTHAISWYGLNHSL